jgi:hypothetical protein
MPSRNGAAKLTRIERDLEATRGGIRAARGGEGQSRTPTTIA